jgi:glycosyltransferase involved in cell wall biosynthesis
VTALAEPNPARRARAHHQVPAPAIFENAPELPATAAVDAVKTLHQGMGCRFSIIVPTHDRPERLLWCLEALAALSCPRERFEVIVVNDGGAMPAARRLAQLAERVQLTIVSQERAGPAHARNLGVEQARGEYLAFTDDDCAPTPEWLAALEEAFLEAPDALVGGRTVNVLDGNLCSEASSF